MVMIDPISDMISRIKNGYLAGRLSVEIPWSKMKESLAKLLKESGYISEVKKEKNSLILTLKYNGKEPGLTEIRRISRPSLRIYAAHTNLPKVLGGAGTAIISTPKGLMTNKQAKKAGVGGEVICEIW
ncbi:30S ribosomal protein S8 [Patescibacteria group bacterium]|nr:30S ribosomal protein S8 [Patescibacteria group bacterium]